MICSRDRIWPFFLSYHLLIGLFFAILWGALAPGAGKAVGKWPFSVTSVCVVTIFVFQGLTLKTSELRQAFTYPKPLCIGLVLILAITPLLGFAFMALHGKLEFQEFAIGLALFCVVPTTVSSGVVITGLAKGNVGLSLVLAVATNIIGVVTVPFLLTLVLGSGGDALRPLPLLAQLCLTVLLPVVVGKLLSLIAVVAATVKRFANTIKLLSSFFLIVIPWIKISQADKEIARVSVGSIFALLGLGIIMHVIFLLVNFAVAVFFKLELGDLKAVVITSSQKTLATGVAIVAALPVSFGEQGLIILPFVFSHFSQIIMDGLMVPWWLRRPESVNLSMFMFSEELYNVSNIIHDGNSGGRGGAPGDGAAGPAIAPSQSLAGAVDGSVIDDMPIAIPPTGTSTVVTAPPKGSSVLRQMDSTLADVTEGQATADVNPPSSPAPTSSCLSPPPSSFPSSSSSARIHSRLVEAMRVLAPRLSPHEHNIPRTPVRPFPSSSFLSPSPSLPKPSSSLLHTRLRSPYGAMPSGVKLRYASLPGDENAVVDVGSPVGWV